MIQLGLVERRLNERAKRGPICAALIDPEEFTPAQAAITAKVAVKAGVGLILIGGSTVANQGRLDSVVRSTKKAVTCDVVLFPGNITGVSRHADAILFSSLLNSTNPYFIIGAQTLGASEVYKAHLETISMGYLVFGNSSTTSLVGQTNGLSPDKPDVAMIYALAAQFLGMRSLYLEAGSGAGQPLPERTIVAVRKVYQGLLFVGGGITNGDKARRATRAGADVVVIGNLLQTKGFNERLVGITKALRAQTRKKSKE